MAGGLEGPAAGRHGGRTGLGKGRRSRTAGPAARRDVWTQSLCCSAESDDTSEEKKKHQKLCKQLRQEGRKTTGDQLPLRHSHYWDHVSLYSLL